MDSSRDVYTVLSTSTLFSFTSDQDFKNSTQYIPEADQGGLGLPDRDYYVKTDEKSEEIRKKYMESIQRTLVLIGEKPLAAAEDAQTILAVSDVNVAAHHVDQIRSLHQKLRDPRAVQPIPTVCVS